MFVCYCQQFLSVIINVCQFLRYILVYTSILLQRRTPEEGATYAVVSKPCLH